MRTILFACRNFDRMAGGVERIASLLMNEMVNRGNKVVLITWDNSDSISHYFLNEEIKWIKLDLGEPNAKASWILRLKRQIKIRNTIKKIAPSVIIGFQVGTFIAIRLAIIGFFIPCIAAERNSPDLFYYQKNGKKNRFIVSIALLFAKCITIQFEKYKFKYPYYLRSRIRTISNPVMPCNNPHLPNESNNLTKRILNVGRLSYQKNQLFLIRSFSLIAEKNPSWVLTIVGEGEYRKSLEELILEKGLQNRVELIGKVKEIDIWYKKSSFLAFPSLWEGFPNALAEALRQGLPAVGLSTTSGVNELLIHKKNGLLSSHDESHFASCLQEMISNTLFRKNAGRFASESIQKFDPNIIFKQWENLFAELSTKN